MEMTNRSIWSPPLIILPCPMRSRGLSRSGQEGPACNCFRTAAFLALTPTSPIHKPSVLRQ